LGRQDCFYKTIGFGGKVKLALMLGGWKTREAGKRRNRLSGKGPKLVVHSAGEKKKFRGGVSWGLIIRTEYLEDLRIGKICERGERDGGTL